MSPHPASYELEGHAAGDHDPRVASHLAECEACRVYVEKSVAAATRDVGPSPPFLKALATPLEATRRSSPIARPRRATARVVRIAFGLAPLAAAAAFAIFLRHPAAPGSNGSDESTPGRQSIQFKGGIQVAIVRERGHDQQRFAASVSVRPHDKIRVEVAVDRERPITVGILGEDGSWLTVLAPALLGSGTHFSERSAEVDEHPTEGYVLAGDPEAVARARATRLFADVAVVAIHPEP